MANTLITKNSSTAAAIPTAGQLVQGELAVNVTDKRVFTENAAGAVVELGVNPSSVTTGALAYTGTLTGGTGVVNIGSGQVYKDASGNVGIGTSSPDTTARLHTSTTSTTARTITESTSSAGYSGYRATNGSGFWEMQIDGANQGLRWLDDGTERLRIDSAGFVGFGTSSPAEKLHVSGAGTQRIRITETGTNLYAQIVQSATNLGLVAAAPNAADNYLTFSTTLSGSSAERLRITSSGNVGIGTSSPSGKLSLVASSNTTDDNILVLGFAFDAGTEAMASLGTHNSDANNGGIKFSTRTNDALTEKMRIDSAGNVGIGTSSPAYPLAVSGAASVQVQIRAGNTSDSVLLFGDTDSAAVGRITYAHADDGMRFTTNGSERARIDSSGNLLVGKTAFSNSGQGTIIGGTSTNGIGMRWTRSTGTGTETALGFYVNGGSQVGSISTTTGNTAYNTSSDYRLKNITGPITTSGAYIDRLNPVEGTWKADGSTFVGLIAHEVQEASRTTVATGVKDGEEMQGMDYSSAEIIANLIAEVKALRTRVAKLEAK